MAKPTGKIIKKQKPRSRQSPPHTDPLPARSQPMPSDNPQHRTVDGLIRVIAANPAMTMNDIAAKLYRSETAWPMVKFMELWQDRKVGLTASQMIQITIAFMREINSRGPRPGEG